MPFLVHPAIAPAFLDFEGGEVRYDQNGYDSHPAEERSNDEV
jgi:hypothetical protein